MIQSDPVFGAAVAEIREQAAEEIEAEIHRRGKEGYQENVYQKGEQVFNRDGSPATITRYSDNLLLARARALMPSKYNEKKSLEVSGNIHHSAGALTVTSADLAALDSTQRDQLTGILKTIQSARTGAPAIEHQPAVIVDADYVEVGEPLPTDDEIEAAIPY